MAVFLLSFREPDLSIRFKPLDLGLRDSVDEITILLELKRTSLGQHVLVQIVPENINFDDEIAVAGTLKRVVELARKFGNISLQSGVRHLSAMRNKANFAPCCLRRI